MTGWFDWDEANVAHLDRKRVEPEEAEEALLDPDRVPAPFYNTATERRRAVFGATETGRVLFIVFTHRQGKIRVVTARDAEPDERQTYWERQRRRR